MDSSTPKPPRPRRTQADRSQATRHQLIKATIEVVRERAFHGASVFEVAKSAGVTPGAFQHHFGSKAELMMEVVAAILQGDEEGGLQWPAASLPLPERAQAMIQGLWRAVYEPDRFIVAWQVYFGCATDPDLRQRILNQRVDTTARLVQRFLEAFPELAARPDAEAQVHLILSSLRGLGMTRLFGDDPSTPAQLDALVQLLVDRCGPPAARPPLPRRKKSP